MNRNTGTSCRRSVGMLKAGLWLKGSLFRVKKGYIDRYISLSDQRRGGQRRTRLVLED